MTTDTREVLIIGSGPAGVQAALELLRRGKKVDLYDIGHRDETYASRIPKESFSKLRSSDGEQRFYFLGVDESALLQSHQEAGAHLTPPRQYMIKDSVRLFPTQCESFFALQSTSCGGLGSSWGANCFSFTSDELARAGMPGREVREIYTELARDIGVSGPADSDVSADISDFSGLQPPLKLDTNCANILKRYSTLRQKLKSKGFKLGQSALAMLSQPLGDRSANPYTDMDFWADHGNSVYRPALTLTELERHDRFRYYPGRLALRFEQLTGNRMRVHFSNVRDGTVETVECRRIVLAAGAINSARLVLQSFNETTAALPLLCNRNHWIACINFPMLGRPVDDTRYSLSQLTALMQRPSDPGDALVAHLYSYRSLLSYKIVREIPFRPDLALQIVRLIQSSLILVNLHFSAHSSDLTRIRLEQETASGPRSLRISHAEDPARLRQDLSDEKSFLSCLRTLRVFPLKVSRPVAGASIHYAGTLPVSENAQPFRCQPTGALWDMSNVFVADSSSWKYLPAKGQTFTLMANARRVAREVASSMEKI